MKKERPRGTPSAMFLSGYLYRELKYMYNVHLRSSKPVCRLQRGEQFTEISLKRKALALLFRKESITRKEKLRTRLNDNS
jgi:hypothetical protein